MSIYWIELPGVRLGIMARPVAMIGWSMTCALLSRGGVDVIVSALTASEAEELGLIAEAEGCARNDLLFIQFPIEDRSLPEHSAEFEQFVKKLLEHLRKERSLVIHCRAGIGRSSLIAASVLTKMGLSADQAFRLIERARGCPVPDTPEQRKWVEQHSGFSKVVRREPCFLTLIRVELRNSIKIVSSKHCVFQLHWRDELSWVSRYAV